MSKITYTATYEIETEHFLDNAKAWSLIKAVNEGGESNLDENTTVELIELKDATMTTDLQKPDVTDETLTDTDEELAPVNI